VHRRLLLVLALAGCSSGGESAKGAESRAGTAERVVPVGSTDTRRAPPSAVVDTATTKPPAGSGRLALPFRARGNEPGWSLDVGTGEMTLVADYGERRVVAATPAPTRSGDTTRWATSAQGHEILVTAVDRLCHDGMSGFPFPRTVAVRLDRRELTGCGGESVEVLLGPQWTVREIDGATVAEASPPTLSFVPDGRVAGRAQCNGFGGSYTLKGDEIAFSDMSGTMIGCAPAVMQREQRFLALLAAVRRFERAGDSLILRTGDGRAITARR